MKINEPVGIFIQHEAISPEVQRAQRMAELKDIAEYRARHLKYITDWSDPVKRAKIQAEQAAAQAAARASLDGKYIDDYRVRKIAEGRFVNPGAIDRPRFHMGPIPERVSDFKITPLVKERPKLSWWRRLLAWLKR